MGIKKCKRCKQIFSPVGGAKICPQCKQEEEKYKTVKDYLWDHPGAKIDEISAEIGVSEELITKFVKEGRFVQLDGVNLKVSCERCGQEISQGRFCDDCSRELQSGFSSSSKKKQGKSNKDLMFTRDD
ncbi:flagellar protein [Halanaerobaculum tunisiense]